MVHYYKKGQKKLKKRFCKYSRLPYQPSKNCMGLFEALYDRTNVCPNCYKAIHSMSMQLREYDKMMQERIKEEILSWDDNTKTCTVKRTERDYSKSDETGSNTHLERVSTFPNCTLEDLEFGLTSIERTRSRHEKNLSDTEKKVEDELGTLRKIKYTPEWDKELDELKNKLQAIRSLSELDNLYESIAESKKEISFQDEQFIQRQKIINHVRGKL